MNRTSCVVLAWAIAGVLVPVSPVAARQRITEPPPNDRVGINIDRFIGDANRSPSRVSHDVMLTRSILRSGDPHQPGDPGAVLRYAREIVVATLPPRNVTPLTRRSEQLILYVQEGTGRLDDGNLYWDLRPGIAILIPPNQAHRFRNDSEEPLEMIMLSLELDPRVRPREGILVRDVDRLACTERGGHWSNMAKYVFLGSDPNDGMFWSDRILMVYMGPMTIAGPHPHTAEQEEVWIKVTDGRALMQLGSEVNPWPKNAGFLVPPTGQTVHAALNLSDDIQAWFYFARPDPNASPPDPNAPGRVNPVIAEALAEATIAGRPLP